MTQQLKFRKRRGRRKVKQNSMWQIQPDMHGWVSGNNHPAPWAGRLILDFFKVSSQHRSRAAMPAPATAARNNRGQHRGIAAVLAPVGAACNNQGQHRGPA